jgi:hypothetical protein
VPLALPPTGSTGPASPPTANPGLEASGDTKVREAVHLLEMALPMFPTGSDKHKAAIDSLSKLSKLFPPSAEVPGAQQTELLSLMQKAKQSAMMQAAMRQQQAAQAQGGGGQAMPPQGGAPPQMPG